jgi:hypothetical protein
MRFSGVQESPLDRARDHCITVVLASRVFGGTRIHDHLASVANDWRIIRDDRVRPFDTERSLCPQPVWCECGLLAACA